MKSAIQHRWQEMGKLQIKHFYQKVTGTTTRVTTSWLSYHFKLGTLHLGLEVSSFTVLHNTFVHDLFASFCLVTRSVNRVHL